MSNNSMKEENVSDSSSDSLGAYQGRGKTMVSGNQGASPKAGGMKGDASPLPAGTPICGRQKSLLGNPNDFQKSLNAANEHFDRSQAEIRDFQPLENGPEEQSSSSMQPRINITKNNNDSVASLSLKKMHSATSTDPLKMSSHEIERSGRLDNGNFLRNPVFHGRGVNTTPAQMQRAISKQDYDISLETAQLKSVIHQVIDEHNSSGED